MRFAACGLGMMVGVATLGATARWSPAFAQLDSREAIALQNQILELRHQMQRNGSGNEPAVAPPVGEAVSPGAVGSGAVGSGSGGSGAGGSPPGGAGELTPQLLDRVSTLEGQVRDLRGQLDQLSNQVQVQNAALAKQIGDLGFAAQQGQPPAGADGVPAAPAGSARPAPAAASRRTAEIALQQGEAALQRRDYAAAQAAAREVLSGPKSPRQLDAQLLLAQSLSGQHQYQQAATAYYDGYSRAPHGARAPEALLGVGTALLALGDKSDACQALHKLHVEFPQPAASVRHAQGLLRTRAGCH